MKTTSCPSSFSPRFKKFARRFFGALLAPLLIIAAQAQVVTFPDANLEAAVRDALQIGAPTNILRADLGAQNFTYFSANNRGIVNLTGLEYATNLTTLQIRGNFGQAGITDISVVSNLTKLTWLEVPYNRITNGAPSAGLTNLTYLDIGWNRDASDNSITDASFVANLKKLKWLGLFYLKLHDLGPVNGLTALTNLTVGFNYGATNGSFTGLTNMIEMHVTDIGISNIAFTAQMPNLTLFDFGYGSVTDISPLLGRNLQGLWSYSNPLTNASLITNFTALTILHADSDNLTNLSAFSRMTGLHELSIDNNPGVPSLAFLSGLTNLTFLSVGQLPLTDVSVLSGLTNLTELHLHDDTNLTSIAPLYSLTNLNNLDLNNCPGLNLSVVTNLVNLNYLNLDHNGLQSASFVLALPHLYQVSLNGNRFTTLDSLAGARLGEIHLSDNHLGDISALLPMDSLNYLEIRNNYLDLSDNSVAWQVITNLQNRFNSSPIYVPVDYDGQMLSSSLTIFDQPVEQCIAVGGNAYFAVSESSTEDNVTRQWQRNGVDLPGETNDFLWVMGTTTNQAGSYRILLQDDNGGVLSDAAALYVGDVNCGRTITIQQQPHNTVVEPGDNVFLTIDASTILTNIYYQWVYNGTNIDGETDSELDLYNVTPEMNGLYQVRLTDDSSNIVYSATAELKVVDIVSFVDPNLSNLVASAIGTTPGDPIHLIDLDSLNDLYINGQGVTNLTGLESARHLDRLDLSYNKISDPSPLRLLTSLSSLTMIHCGLSNANFITNMVNLFDLNLSNDYDDDAGNHIHSIPDVSNLVNLRYLTINRNRQLVNLPRLAILTNLFAISLHSDRVPDISFTTGMKHLTTVDMGGDWMFDDYRNTIRDISPLADKTDINWLSLTWNQVTNVPLVSAFPLLGNLYLSSNAFQNINFISNMPNLREFSADHSQVTNVTPLATHPLLTSLDISYIATTNISVLSGLTNLQGLTAGGNHCGSAAMLTTLTNLNSLTFDLNDVPDISPIANMTNLYWLQLENNHIPDISVFTNKTKVQNMYLSGNQIHDLTPLSGLTNLNSLSLSVNGFTNVAPLAGLTNLNWLVMQSNHVQNVNALVGLSNHLGTLDLSYNALTNMSPLTNLYTLNWLGVWQNKMTTLPSLTSLSNITSLDFTGNLLTNFSGVSGMTQLTWLSFKSNSLTTASSLTGLPNLNSLDLSYNQLTNISALTNLPQLNWLGLNSNKLTTVPLLTGLPNLNSLDLSSNQLTDVSSLTILTNLGWLYLQGNNLQTIHSLTNLPHLNYINLIGNLLDTNSTASAFADIGILQTHVYVDYLPQRVVTGLPPVILTNALVLNNQFKFKFLSQTNQLHTIESSTDLTNWTQLSTLPGDGTVKTLNFSPASQPKIFYRVRTH